MPKSAQTTPNVKFMFSNVAYRVTVYRTGAAGSQKDY
jgi:hypothetical protein